MLPISARDPVRFTPDRYGDDAGVPVYLIEVPTLRTKAAFNRACVAAGLVTHDRATIIATLREGVSAQIEADQAGPLIDMLDRLEVASEVQPADPRDLEDFALLQADMRRHFPKFAGMMGDAVHYQQMAPIVAAETFLGGWEGVGTPFRRRNGAVDADVLETLPEADVLAIGNRALSLFAPSEDQSKNSGSPSPSRGGRKSSRETRRKATPGKSPASGTNAIPPDGSPATTG